MINIKSIKKNHSLFEISVDIKLKKKYGIISRKTTRLLNHSTMLNKKVYKLYAKL